MTQLSIALEKFIAIYHGSNDLVDQNKDWNSRISMIASNSEEINTLEILQGRVANTGAPLQEVDLLISAEEQVLLDILKLRRDPNEPYLFGELTVQGDEGHFLRLDYIVTMLCPT